MNGNETICALATAPGGALGIIRVSGPNAISIADSICRGAASATPANTIHFARIVSPHSCVSSVANKQSSSTEGMRDERNTLLLTEEIVIDEAMVSVFRAPHSYTGEDSVEISCHGSRYILNKVLELLIANGCRMATPGEYTMRAYLNGKMDLSQAEAVADLIASNNRASHQIAMSQLRGHFSSELARLREHLLELTSLLELELDFSDHEDLEFADRTELLTLAQHIDDRISQLADSFERGQAIKEGIPVAIVGKTNVGKSTLLNQLLGDDRAIVSDIHGTTRDTIEDVMNIDGITFRFIDTAGIRETTDQVERIGIERTMQAIKKAHIVIWLLDEHPTTMEQQAMAMHCKGKELIVANNKADIGIAIADSSLFIPHSSFLQISAKTGQGIDNLKRRILEESHIKALSNNDIIVNNARHYDVLLRAHESITTVINGLQQNLSGDLLAEDLRQAIDILAEITGGQITPQETLNNIFKYFCVGK